jgi:hypothetical protein
MRTLILAVIAALSLNVAQAVEVAGVKFEDTDQSRQCQPRRQRRRAAQESLLQGLCHGALLAGETGGSRSRVVGQGCQTHRHHLLRDLSAQQFVDALQEGVASNHTESEMTALKDRMQQFSDAMLSIGEAKTGSQVFIDLLPEGATRLTVNGQVRGSDFAGEDFFNALLKIWLGNKPVQDDLKQALLGKAS